MPIGWSLNGQALVIRAQAIQKRHKTRAASVVGDDVRPGYDFTGGERGKHHEGLREQGCIVRVYNVDGTMTERHVAGKRTVILEPDVYEYFPDSEAVNLA